MINSLTWHGTMSCGMLWFDKYGMTCIVRYRRVRCSMIYGEGWNKMVQYVHQCVVLVPVIEL